jgi:small-conductance mechanosensitive channel
MGPFDRFETAVETYLGISPPVTEGILETGAAILAWLVLERLARSLLARVVKDTSLRFQVNKAVGYGLGLVTVLVVLKIWVRGGLSGFATYLGLLSAGLAIALQDPVANFAGWIYIIVRRPFGIGDRVQVAQHTGDVVDIRPFRFLMLEIGNWVHADQSTGRVIHVPNAMVFKNAVANYDDAFGYIWNELEVVVTLESNWRSAKSALEKILAAHAEKLTPDVTTRIRLAAESMHIKFGKLTPIVWTSLVPNGVCLTMRYLCKPRERRSSASAIWEHVLEELGPMPDVEFAYPTQRVFDNPTEGKPGARADGEAPRGR